MTPTDPDARRSSRRARGTGNWSRLPAGLAAALLIAGCASFHPQPLDKVGFEQRAQSSTDGQVTASVTALTEKEARGALGVDISGAGIQPVWVKIENREAIGYVITPIVIDHEYFSPTEAAWQAHGLLSGGTNARIDEYFRSLHLPERAGPGETVSGFVFTNLDKGVKYVSVELISARAEQVRRFAFLAKVPDLNADYLPIERESLYDKDEIKELDEAGFHAWVEQLPCCVLGGDRKTPGDPLNVVFVGEHSGLVPRTCTAGLARDRRDHTGIGVADDRLLRLRQSLSLRSGLPSVRPRQAPGPGGPEGAQRHQPAHPHAPVAGASQS